MSSPLGSLANRGVLQIEEVKRLKVITTTHYRLHESYQPWVARVPLDGVHHLLGATAQARPQLWQLLHEQIQQGLARRQERQWDSAANDRDFGSSSFGGDNW